MEYFDWSGSEDDQGQASSILASRLFPTKMESWVLLYADSPQSRLPIVYDIYMTVKNSCNAPETDHPLHDVASSCFGEYSPGFLH